MLRLSCLLILALAASAMAAPLYKVTDENGNVTFTDQPPADGTKSDSKPVEQKPLNVLESPPDKDYQKSFDRNQTKAQERRKTAWDTYDQELADAEQELSSAQKAQKDGESLKEGDMVGTTGRKGATFMRPSDEYLQRQEELKRAVTDAEARLNAVKKNRPMLHRN
jgi:hypothetical protein